MWCLRAYQHIAYVPFSKMVQLSRTLKGICTMAPWHLLLVRIMDFLQPLKIYISFSGVALWHLYQACHASLRMWVLTNRKIVPGPQRLRWWTSCNPRTFTSHHLRYYKVAGGGGGFGRVRWCWWWCWWWWWWWWWYENQLGTRANDGVWPYGLLTSWIFSQFFDMDPIGSSHLLKPGPSK